MTVEGRIGSDSENGGGRSGNYFCYKAYHSMIANNL